MSQAPTRLQYLPCLIQPYEIKYVQRKKMPVADILPLSTVAGDNIPDKDITVNDVVTMSTTQLEQIREITSHDPRPSHAEECQFGWMARFT